MTDDARGTVDLLHRLTYCPFATPRGVGRYTLGLDWSLLRSDDVAKLRPWFDLKEPRRRRVVKGWRP